MRERTTLNSKDLFEISEETGVPIRALSSMDEYQSKRLKPNNPPADREKLSQMIQAGHSMRKIALEEKVSTNTLLKIKKQWLNIAFSGNTATVVGKEDALLKELLELKKTHNTDVKISPEIMGKISTLLSSATYNLHSYTQRLTTVSIAIDNKKNFHISFSNKHIPAKLKEWARENKINFIESSGHAEESLINAVSDIIHIESSRDICLECEYLLLKNNIGTSRPFSHKLSKNRQKIGYFSDETIENSKKMIEKINKKKSQRDEVGRLLLEGKLSLPEISKITGGKIGSMCKYPEYKIWQKLRQQEKSQDPRIIKASQLLQQGKTQKEIAKELGVTELTVKNWLKEQQEQIHNSKIEKIIQLKQQGKKHHEIAKELGMSKTTIHHLLKEQQVKSFDSEREKVGELLLQGKTQIEIANELGISQSTIKQLIKQQRKQARESQIEKVLQLKQQGKTQKKIAEELGLSRSVV